jgi:hypothetical protein
MTRYTDLLILFLLIMTLGVTLSLSLSTRRTRCECIDACDCTDAGAALCPCKKTGKPCCVGCACKKCAAQSR